jgi:hypothetical protein
MFKVDRLLTLTLAPTFPLSSARLASDETLALRQKRASAEKATNRLAPSFPQIIFSVEYFYRHLCAAFKEPPDERF